MNIQRFLEYIKRQGNKVATFFKSRDVVTFLLFFLLALFMWYSYTASTQREISKKIPIKYIGIPHNVSLEKRLPYTLKFVIKDQGKTIWNYKNSLFDTLTIDLSNHFNNNNILEIRYEEHINKISSLLSPSTKITELTPGYFQSSYIKLHTKQVPVVTSNVIKLAPQHVMYDTISISPKYITLVGTAEAIDTISYLYLEPITSEFNKTKTIPVNIQKPNNIELDYSSVNVTIPVEMCTEKEVIVPITIENLPKGISLKTFPSEVKIRFSVGLSHYNKVTEETFQAILDYNNIINNPEEYTTTLQIDYTSGYIFNIQINPSEVEFLIENTK